MKIVNKKKFIVRIIELLVIIATIILTVKAIAYATAIRGYKAYGGEYLIPIIGLVIILVLEAILEEILFICNDNINKKEPSISNQTEK